MKFIYHIIFSISPTGGPVLVTEVAKSSQLDLTPQIRKSERLVFEETHPNIPNHVKQVPLRKPSIPSVSNTDNLKTIRNENIPHKVESKIETDPLVHSVKSLNKNLPRNEIIFGELDGIDADSLFGDF